MESKGLNDCPGCGKAAAFVRLKYFDHYSVVGFHWEKGLRAEYYVECANCSYSFEDKKSFKNKNGAINCWNNLKKEGVKNEYC